MAEVKNWADGIHLGASDDQLLAAAFSDQRALVTYDCLTIIPLLQEWAETGRHHGGVILVDDRTIRANDIRGLLRALVALVERGEDYPWEDRMMWLQPA